jgi:hypothetical protein
MSQNRKHIQLYRNLSATTFSNNTELSDGELAVGKDRLFLRNSGGDIATFSSDKLLLSLKKAIGISVSGLGDDDFYYNSILTDKTNVSANLDDIGARMRYVSPYIETKFKVDMMDVENNGVIYSQPTFYYDIECPVDFVCVSKVNGGNITTIYSGSSQSYSGSVSIGDIEEEYVLEFVPSEIPNVMVQEKIYTYVCCTASTSAETMDSNTVAQLSYIIASDGELSKEVDTLDNDYIYLLIPSDVKLDSFKSQNLPIKLNEETSSLEASNGSLTCYRTLKKLAENEWNTKIKLSGMKRGRKKLISIDEAIGSAFVEEMLARSGVVGYAVAGKAIVGWS